MSDMPAPAPVSRTHDSTGDKVEITERRERRIVFLIEKTNGLIDKSNGLSGSVRLTLWMIPTIFLSTPMPPSGPMNELRRSAEVEPWVRLTGAGAGMSLMSGRTMAYGHNVPEQVFRSFGYALA